MVALFYKEQGRIAGGDYAILADWDQGSNLSAMEKFQTFMEITPSITIGKRVNMKFGDQFGYRFNRAERPDVFCAIAQFGSGVVIAGLIVEQALLSLMNDADDKPAEWVKVLSIFDDGVGA